MGYWAKNGAYVHDESDTELMEAMNETQGQHYDRIHRNDGVAGKPLFNEKEEAQRESAYAERVEARAKFYEGNREYRKQQEEREQESQNKEDRKKSYENAKARFRRLSSVKKIWLNITGKGINSYSANSSVEVLDSLYSGKSR